MMSSSRAIQTATVKTEGSSFLSKLSKYLAVLIIFFSATQLGLHFWPSSTLVYGIRIDYLSPTLYFLDILIILYLCLQGLTLKEVPNPAVSKAGKVRPYWNFSETGSDLVGTILPLLLTNFLYSQNPLATLSWSIHLILYICFVVTIGPDLKKIITPIITLSLLFQTIIAAAQVYLGHSVAGIMCYLGERMASVGSPGIALGSFMDQVVLRAYGTFSHPNILAGFAVISLLITIQLWRQLQSSVGLTLKDSSAISTRKDPKRSDPMSTKIIWVPLIPVALIVLLTQSRSAAISLFGIIIPFYLIKKLKYRLLYFVIIFSLLTSPFSLLHPTRTELSSLQRITLQNLSISVIRSFPVFGTGAQSSISTYPGIDTSVRLLQPDHNSFTLFLSWFGIFGIIGVLYSLRPTTYNLRSLLPILPLLLFDHYLLTSPQGMFVLMLYLGLVGLQPPGLKSTSHQRV